MKQCRLPQGSPAFYSMGNVCVQAFGTPVDSSNMRNSGESDVWQEMELGPGLAQLTEQREQTERSNNGNSVTQAKQIE
jgi:hypothetical protein